jgi:DNA-binding NtrC family response regulator
VRIVSATNADLKGEVAGGKFRQDLLFRLNTIEIALPPLRERREDIPLMAAHFLKQLSIRYRKQVVGFEEPAIQVLLNHPWPGNIRELNHAVERAVLMAQRTLIQAPDLGLQSGATEAKPLDEMSLEEVERFLIKKTLARSGGNARQAADVLGLSRSAFYRRLEKYGL